MSNTQSSAREAFDISNWRQSVKDRRELVRSIIIRAVIQGEQLEPVLDDLKKALGFAHLDDKDRNLAYVIFHDIRTVVGGWRHPITRGAACVRGGQGSAFINRDEASEAAGGRAPNGAKLVEVARAWSQVLGAQTLLVGMEA